MQHKSKQVGSVLVTDPCAAPDDTPDGTPNDSVSAGEAELEVAVRVLDPQLPLPAYAHPGDAGADLCSAVEVTIAPGERVLVPTGVAIALPTGHAGFVHPRSGLAARHGISIVNAPGTVDEGYRGEILVNLVNLDPSEAFTVRRGDRIAQLVVQRVERPRFVQVDSLTETSRGDTGHGSTGGFGGAPAAAGESAAPTPPPSA
ncbi:dUTP pyrophosphatase [Humibacillus xanthopallidus]|uniref:Deoxyuridine 5'-triphosphate nucleotidohydrolase n=1 Tax=Humibacillus xanthopallidus TaxID=412689 RepID=A0A543PU54_9MICO|nr:dUTP pyrophosphatase [Humibacillus xanthopallidus]